MADKKKDEGVATVTTTDREGNEFETEMGVDGKNPVSVNNPPAKAISEDDADVVKEEQEKVEERTSDLKGSDGPGKDHNAEEGTTTAADRRAGRSRPTTPADPSVAQPSAKDQDADNKSK